MIQKTLEFRILAPKWKQGFTDLFDILRTEGDDKYFHPHPLTKEEAERLCSYSGKDLYYICVEGTQVLGYGMLRGWDEGYEIPSLGIAVHPKARRIGLGRAIIYFLHVVAYRRGARKIRIKVSSNNVAAIKLYKKVGYEFKIQEDGQYVGFLEL